MAITLMRMFPKRAIGAAILVLLLVAGVAAWALTSRTESTPSRRSDPALAGVAKRLPFFGLLYEQSPAEIQVAEAQRQLAIDCMARQGFTYRPVQVAGATGTAEAQPAPFGLESLTPPQPTAPSVAPAEASPSPAFTRALFGNPAKRISAKGKTIRVSRPADGCLAEAEIRLLGTGRLHWLQLRVQLGDGEQAARQQLAQDPQFQAATKRWQQCMRTAGYEQKDPVTLLYGLPRGTDPARNPLTRADVQCKENTNYLTTAYGRLEAAQKTWLGQHATLLSQWNALQLRRENTARTVLKTGN